MRTRLLVLTTVIAAALAAMLSSCGKTGPTGPSQGHSLVRVTISGPSSIAPDSTAQMTATAIYSDGLNTDVTNTASWRSDNTEVLSISATGTAAGLTLGGANISVSSLGLTSSVEMLVLPAGTYRLAGTVVQSGVGVDGVKIEVTAGQGTGLSTLTAGAGTYALYGVAGDVQLQVSKAGYVTQTRSVGVVGNATLNVDLSLANPLADFTGTYLLSISASGSCPKTGGSLVLPDDGRSRRYTAVISQTGERLLVTLSGADFFLDGSSGNHFSGRAEPDRVTFSLNGEHDSPFPTPYDLAEQLAPGRVFLASGQVSAVPSRGDIIGTLAGDMLIIGGPSTYFGWCHANDHEFTLRRQSSGLAPTRVRR